MCFMNYLLERNKNIKTIDNNQKKNPAYLKKEEKGKMLGNKCD